jgi:hypothetical protein
MAPEEILKDEYATVEEKETAKKMVALEAQAHVGAIFEDWMRHQAGQFFAKYLEQQIVDARNKWLIEETREKAEHVRIHSQAFLMVKQWIASQIATGRLAGQELKKFHEEGQQLEGQIRLPPRP